MKKYILFYFFLLSAFPLLASGWQQKTSLGAGGRHRGLGISIGNKGYIGTGHYNGAGPNIVLDDWWEFDPSSNSWSQKANVPTPTYGSIGWGTATKGYVGAGFIGGGIYHVYDPATNSWSNTSSCPISASDRTCFMVNGKGYVLSSTQMAEYDPANDNWTQKAGCPSNVYSWSCAFETLTSGFVKTGSSFYEYKPSADSWVARANFPGLTSSGATAFQIHNKGYVVCGYSGGLGNVNNELWEFDPGSGLWSQLGNFPGTSRRFLISFTIASRGYVGIGTNGTNFNDFWRFSYDPLGEDELDLTSDNVKVFPNPALNKATVSIEKDKFELLEQAKIVVTSLDGKMISEQNMLTPNTTIERNSAKRGVYFYSIVENNETIFTGKLIYQ